MPSDGHTVLRALWFTHNQPPMSGLAAMQALERGPGDHTSRSPWREPAPMTRVLLHGPTRLTATTHR
jgi:hypothetical protein